MWTRLRPGDTDPVTGHPHTRPQPTAQLSAGDVLVVDEAGMLDQETSRALLDIAGETDAEVPAPSTTTGSPTAPTRTASASATT